MAAKTYWLKFGSGDARAYSGLTPTFLQFFDNTGATMPPPTITEIKYGGVTASGIYGFSFTISSTQSIYFLANSATILTNANDNYVTGVLDPVLAVDQQLGIAGLTGSIGTTSVDPTSIYGYLKRLQELLEGDQVFTASSGIWQIYNRTSLGVTTLLRTKTILNSGAGTTKTGL